MATKIRHCFNQIGLQGSQWRQQPDCLQWKLLTSPLTNNHKGRKDFNWRPAIRYASGFAVFFSNLGSRSFSWESHFLFFEPGICSAIQFVLVLYLFYPCATLRHWHGAETSYRNAIMGTRSSRIPATKHPRKWFLAPVVCQHCSHERWNKSCQGGNSTVIHGLHANPQPRPWLFPHLKGTLLNDLITDPLLFKAIEVN